MQRHSAIAWTHREGWRLKVAWSHLPKSMSTCRSLSTVQLLQLMSGAPKVLHQKKGLGTCVVNEWVNLWDWDFLFLLFLVKFFVIEIAFRCESLLNLCSGPRAVKIVSQLFKASGYLLEDGPSQMHRMTYLYINNVRISCVFERDLCHVEIWPLKTLKQRTCVWFSFLLRFRSRHPFRPWVKKDPLRQTNSAPVWIPDQVRFGLWGTSRPKETNLH